MSEAFLGIDLGTSSVKALCLSEDMRTRKVRVGYDEPTPEGWRRAVLTAVAQIEPADVVAVGLSAQTGTYVVDGRDVIGWNSDAGSKELSELCARYPQDAFLRELGMAHPPLASYPIPRLAYIRKQYGEGVRVCQPKELLAHLLTGAWIGDPYTWRGMADPATCRYSARFLQETGNPILPELRPFTGRVGSVTEQASSQTGLRVGIPVYAGLNDFYASLLGLGAIEPGDLFDITGTSEHLGVVETALRMETPLISSPFLDAYVHYGVTASSGASLDFGMRCFRQTPAALNEALLREAPIFTPYLNGERAPIFDSAASGTFFGITGMCGPEHLAYSVLEGVAFSLFHIYETMGMPPVRRILAGGGAAGNPILNRIKAELFGLPLFTREERESSALGAAMVAATGFGACTDVSEAVRKFCRTAEHVLPDGRLRPLLLARYRIYKEVYPALSKQYGLFGEVRK